jgi:hypothetical protein
MTDTPPETPSETTTPDTGETNQESPDTTSEPTAAAEAKQRAYWQREARKKDKALAEANAALETLREKSKTAEEKVLDDARKSAREDADKEWTAKYRTLAVRNKALSVLAATVRAPDLVLAQLDLKDIEVNDDGEVDETDLKARINAVLDQYPFLAVGAAADPPHPHADLGARKQAPASKDASTALRDALKGR